MKSSTVRRLARSLGAGLLAGCTVVATLLTITAAAGAAPPPIRLSDTNQVPDCVTPDRLMRFLATRNRKLNPTFRRIAEWYKYHGESWRVRWDYAFYQMAIETNFLTYRAPNGRWGDVNPKQNNFAGLGTTGGGVPGDSYPNVSTGVLAQIQHLVVYSGEHIPQPVGPRTRLKQDVILRLSRPVAARRPVTFQDLSGRWAVDRRYGRSIEYVARLYRKKFCRGVLAKASRKRDTRAAPQRPFAGTQPPRLAARPQLASRAPAVPRSIRQAMPQRVSTCKVQVASYGGTTALLIRSQTAGDVQLTALEVQPQCEDSMARDFIANHAAGGYEIARFPNQSAALARAHDLCKTLVK